MAWEPVWSSVKIEFPAGVLEFVIRLRLLIRIMGLLLWTHAALTAQREQSVMI